MPKIENLPAVIRELQQQKEKYGEPVVSVITGFNAEYAVYVHEAVGMVLKGKLRPRRRGVYRGRFWDPQGQAQAKFLETPARRLKPVFARMVRTAVGNGATINEALKLLGLRLQREAMELVPVDTTNLKGSAFIETEEGFKEESELSE